MQEAFRARSPRAAPFRGLIPGSPPLRFPLRLQFPFHRARLRDGGSSSEEGGRVCARARALVRGRVPAFPCAPAPASCPPRSDASRISNARSHPPGRSHSRARAPLRRTPGSARPTRPPGATTKSPERGPRCSLANLRLPAGLVSGPLGLPEGSPGASLLRHHATPGRGQAPSLNPGWGAQLGLPALAPKGAGSLLARATARSRVLSCSFLSPLR